MPLFPREDPGWATTAPSPWTMSVWTTTPPYPGTTTMTTTTSMPPTTTTPSPGDDGATLLALAGLVWAVLGVTLVALLLWAGLCG